MPAPLCRQIDKLGPGLLLPCGEALLLLQDTARHVCGTSAQSLLSDWNPAAAAVFHISLLILLFAGRACTAAGPMLGKLGCQRGTA